MLLFPHFGRATIYMAGLSTMFVLLLAIGGLGFSNSDNAKTAVAVLFVISTLVNMISTGPVCYPIGYWAVYVQPHWDFHQLCDTTNGVSAWFVTHAAVISETSLTYFYSLELGCQKRPFLCRHQLTL